MTPRTWKYGTRLTAKVLDVIPGTDPLRPKMTTLTAEGEAHVIVHVTHAIEPVRGNIVTMEFTQGGPTGGHWRIVG